MNTLVLREISADILAHWMDLMNSEGWIPREQILGKEARAKVRFLYLNINIYNLQGGQGQGVVSVPKYKYYNLQGAG